MPQTLDLQVANKSGMRWMLVSVLGAAAMTLAARSASVEVDSRVIVLMRALGGLALTAAILGPLPRLRGQIAFTRPWLHIARGTMIAISTHLGFWAIAEIPLATATVLFFSAPIFTTILAPFVLGERVGPRRIGAVVAGFIGVLIIVRPGVVEFEFAYGAALFSSFLYAVVLLMSRAMGNSDGAWATYLSSTVITIVISIPITASVWALPATSVGWIAIGVVTLASLIRNIADIEAYRAAEASLLAPLAYTRIVLIAAGAYLMFDETPDGPTLLGGAVIILSAFYIAHRERVRSAGRT